MPYSFSVCPGGRENRFFIQVFTASVHPPSHFPKAPRHSIARIRRSSRHEDRYSSSVSTSLNGRGGTVFHRWMERIFLSILPPIGKAETLHESVGASYPFFCLIYSHFSLHALPQHMYASLAGNSFSRGRHRFRHAPHLLLSSLSLPPHAGSSVVRRRRSIDLFHWRFMLRKSSLRRHTTQGG